MQSLRSQTSLKKKCKNQRSLYPFFCIFTGYYLEDIISRIQPSSLFERQSSEWSQSVSRGNFSIAKESGLFVKNLQRRPSKSCPKKGNPGLCIRTSDSKPIPHTPPPLSLSLSLWTGAGTAKRAIKSDLGAVTSP